MALHHLTKKAAVAKYGQIEATEEEVKKAIAADEKGFTPEDVEEIFAAIMEEKNAPDPEPEPEVYGAKKRYVEWDVKIEGKKAEKLKAGRKVKITDEQADILNQGVTEGGNTYAKMYFPEEKK